MSALPTRPSTTPPCPRCHSTNTASAGPHYRRVERHYPWRRTTWHRTTQREFYCLDCHHAFCVEPEAKPHLKENRP